VREAAWPVIRHDLSLSYAQVGLLLSIPGLASLALEPAIGVLGDLGRRRALVVGGGLTFAAALLFAAAAPGFGLLLGAFLLLFPSSDRSASRPDRSSSPQRVPGGGRSSVSLSSRSSSRCSCGGSRSTVAHGAVAFGRRSPHCAGARCCAGWRCSSSRISAATSCTDIWRSTSST
jgi:MFS family permease